MHEHSFCSLPVRLLDVIAGRKNPVGLKQGLVLVDGRAVTSELRLSSAYVVQVHIKNKATQYCDVFLFCLVPSSVLLFQDDILMGTLSVRENLLFSANLRLNPKDHSTEDKKNRVNEIIQDLGLTDCADTKVGSWSSDFTQNKDASCDDSVHLILL